MKKYNNTNERVPFYYRYLGRLVDQGIENVHAKDIAAELGFKSATSIVRDFNLFIDSPGNLKYGYNNVFMYNSFKKLMKIENGVNIAVVGSESPLLDNDECSRRGFNIIGTLDKIDKELIYEHEIKALILTDRDVLPILDEIPDCIEIVINLTGKEIDDRKFPFYVVNVDILEILANAWYLKEIEK